MFRRSMGFLRFLLLLLISICLFFFVSFLNLKIIFYNVDTAKKILNDSNLYPVAAAGIRDNIVKYAEIPVDQSKLIEIVNSSITEADLKYFVEDYTDQFYALVNGKDKDGKITLHFTWLRDKVTSQVGNNKELTQIMNENNVLTDRETDLNSNAMLKVLIHLNSYLIGFGIATLFFIGLLLLSGSWAQKLIWLGATFLVSGIGFIGELIFYYFGMSKKVLELLAKQSGLQDQQFLIGVQKLITAVARFQRIYYLIVTASLIFLGIVFIIIGNLIKPQVSTAPQIEPAAPEKAPSPPVPAQPTPTAAPATPVQPTETVEPAKPSKSDKKDKEKK